ncbi:Calcium-dependent phosphotriesterase superfamily protein [Trifolium repens]|nr:Calcium-dependent phosphotriesterase superfamily protein [Trifolium repens]
MSNETVIVLDDLAFANGVALSKDEDYVVVCETWKFRCLKHWLKGINNGKTDIFIENLPAGPDNINLAPDGTCLCMQPPHQYLSCLLSCIFCLNLIIGTCLIIILTLQFHPFQIYLFKNHDIRVK